MGGDLVKEGGVARPRRSSVHHNGAPRPPAVTSQLTSVPRVSVSVSQLHLTHNASVHVSNSRSSASTPPSQVQVKLRHKPQRLLLFTPHASKPSATLAASALDTGLTWFFIATTPQTRQCSAAFVAHNSHKTSTSAHFYL